MRAQSTVEKMYQCKFNKLVECIEKPETGCRHCGWNPVEGNRRLKRLELEFNEKELKNKDAD